MLWSPTWNGNQYVNEKLNNPTPKGHFKLDCGLWCNGSRVFSIMNLLFLKKGYTCVIS